jgi:hypothetical protein
MGILILLICFVSVFFSVSLLTGSAGLSEIVIKTVLVFSILLVFITELTSLFHWLNFKSVLLSWTVVFILNVVFLFTKKKEVADLILIIKNYLTTIYNGLNKFEKFMFFSIAGILLLVFLQGILYPPNNWDSMVYHMARIPNWISHQSVSHYPTPILLQIYQPPFAEFAILHFNILSGGDYFSNSVQFFFLVFSLFTIVQLSSFLGLNRKLKLLAIILTATIPEILLEGSSTQNDVVGSFFILASAYAAIKAFNGPRFQNYFFLGLAVGLAVLTKGTAYVFLTPILLIFSLAVSIRSLKTKNYSHIGYSAIAVLLFLAINSGHYIRNFGFSQNLLGLDKIQTPGKDFNENMNAKLLLLNLMKNAGLQIPYPLNKFYDKEINKLHVLIDVHNRTNYDNMKYEVSDYPNDEDFANNPLHFFLVILSLALIGIYKFKSKSRCGKPLLYVSVLTLQILLFCFIFKWTPWHTRLHTSLFMLSVPLICYSANLNEKHLKALYKIIPFIILYALLVVLFNAMRPFIFTRFTSKISITDSRYKKYFAKRPYYYNEFNSVVRYINAKSSKNIGLILGSEDWEYPLFCQFYNRQINPIHINVSNKTQALPLNTSNIDCIVSTTLNDSVIDFNGKRFYNQNIKTEYIRLYK